MKKILISFLLILFLGLFSLQSNSQEPCDGCVYNNECIVVGDQISIDNVLNYCSLSKQLVPVKVPGQSCQNNFECSNGFCSYGVCESKYQEIIEQKSLIQQLIAIISGLDNQDINTTATPPSNPPSSGDSGSGGSRRCIPNWQCTEFSICINGQQQRSCADSNRCNTQSNKPVLARSCVINPAIPQCNEAWQCTPWSICKDDEQTRGCNDLNVCGTEYNKPNTIQSCQKISPSTPDKNSTTLVIVIVVFLILIISIVYWYIKK